jgi:LacI family transcriptional regulator, repressor for deo operon, udp, cdd, tsx, nupC, and nupG
MAGVRQIAQVAGVSPATVSRVLNNASGYSYSQDTRRRVIEAAKQLGYRPDPHARALGGGKAPVIKLIYELRAVYDSTSYLKAQHLTNALTHLGRDVTVVGLLHRRPVAEAVAALIWGSPEAVVIERTAASPEFLYSLCAELNERGIHVLRANCWRQLPADEACDAITVDHAHGAGLTLAHLGECGHEKIARLEGESTFLREAYTQALACQDLAVDCFSVRYGPSLADGPHKVATAAREAAQSLLERNPQVTALFCDNDMAALGAMQAMAGLGLRVPDDVAVIGYFGEPWTEFLPIPLTTVVQPLQEMCDLARQLLKARLDGSTEPWQRLTVAPQLIVRASTCSSKPRTGKRVSMRAG